ncbi:MAG: aminotransferase class IV [Thermodesulfobacteriota bacterium]
MFTACRTVNGKILRLEDHLDRLYNSAVGIYMQPPLPRHELRDLMSEIVRKNFEISGGQDLLIDIVFSGGLEAESMRQSGTGAHLYVAVRLLTHPAPELYETGVALATFPFQRKWADIKLLNYVGAVIAHQTAVPRHSAYDVLFLDPVDGRTILEGSTFSVFFVNGQGRVLTYPLDGKILDSITRRIVLELLRAHRDILVEEVPVTLDQLPQMAEAFIVSTTRNVLPVTRIDDRAVGDGKPGSATKTIRGIFDEFLISY